MLRLEWRSREYPGRSGKNVYVDCMTDLIEDCLKIVECNGIDDRKSRDWVGKTAFAYKQVVGRN